MYKFEICANSVESCVEAQRGGADRVELCAGIPEGGTTPSYGDIVMAKRVLGIVDPLGLRPLPLRQGENIGQPQFESSSLSQGENIGQPQFESSSLRQGENIGLLQFDGTSMRDGENKRTKLHVILRPRGGDFLYSDLERQIMLEDVRMARQLGVDGVVFGALLPNGDIDMDFMQQLMAESEGMSVTFHRAFDVCRDPFEALEQIIELGCDRILTSGQMPKAEEGVDLLKQLVDKAGDRIIIMPGCGVNVSNIARIAEETGAKEFHFSARSKRDSGMQFRRSRVSMGGTVTIDEYSRDVTDAVKVAETILQITDNR